MIIFFSTNFHVTTHIFPITTPHPSPTPHPVFDTFPNKELIVVVRSTLSRKSGPAACRELKKLWSDRGVRVVEGEAMIELEDGATHFVSDEFARSSERSSNKLNRLLPSQKTDKGTEVCEVEGTRAIWCTGRGKPKPKPKPKPNPIPNPNP